MEIMNIEERVPWWVLLVVMLLLFALAWYLIDRWGPERERDPDEWWDDRRLEALKVLGEDYETKNRMEAIREAFTIHYFTLHDCAWMDRVAMLKALDHTAEVVKILLEDTES